MNYIVCKNFNKKGIDKTFELLRGATVTLENGVIKHNGYRICYSTSQNAYDFFSRNDDSHGFERFDLIQDILGLISSYVAEYNQAMAELEATFTEETTDEERETAYSAVTNKVAQAYDTIRNTDSSLLRNEENIFTFDFYNARISLLQNIKSLITNL